MTRLIILRGTWRPPQAKCQICFQARSASGCSSTSEKAERNATARSSGRASGSVHNRAERLSASAPLLRRRRIAWPGGSEMSNDVTRVAPTTCRERSALPSGSFGVPSIAARRALRLWPTDSRRSTSTMIRRALLSNAIALAPGSPAIAIAWEAARRAISSSSRGNPAAPALAMRASTPPGEITLEKADRADAGCVLGTSS